MDGGFDVRAVEVCGGAVGGVEELGGKGEDIPEERTLLIDFVDVETGVDCQSRVVDHVEDVAISLTGKIEEHCWLISGRGEGQVFFSEVGVAAGLVETFDLSEERFIELEKGLVLQNKGYGCDLFLGVVELADDGVVDQRALRRA